jgi:hypothetical protein
LLLALLLAGTAACSEDQTAAPAVEQTPRTTQSPGTTQNPQASVPPSPASRPSFPPQAGAEHGAKQTAVYLAVAYSADDPKLKRAEAQAKAVGYDNVGIGDIGCDQGAREALGLDVDRDYYGAAVYFADRGTAQQFVDAYEPGVVGMADVTTFCLD